jgi:hypothetical protein
MLIMMVTQFDTTRQEHAETVKVMTPACNGYLLRQLPHLPESSLSAFELFFNSPPD